MNMHIFSLELRNLRRSAVTGTISIGCVLYAMLAFFPAMQTESMRALAGAKLEGMPPALLAAIGLNGIIDFSIVTVYFGYIVQYIALAIMVLVTQQAVALFIKEETDGTIEFLCAKPVSRSEIFAQKVLALLSVFVGMSAVYWAVASVGYMSFGGYSPVEAMRESGIFFSAILFVGVLFSSVGLLLSTLVKSSRGASGVTIAIVFGTFILGVLSAVIERLHFLVWFSPMDWIKADKLMTEGIRPQEWIVGIAVIVGCALAAWLRYWKKDLLV